MDLPVVIEPMRESDLKEMAAIEYSSFIQPWSLQSYVAELRYNHLACYLVARYEGRLIGYIGAWMVIDEGHITTIAVDSAYRRQNVAGRLLRALIEEGRRLDVFNFTLEVRESNLVAINFYKKWGFVENGRRKHYYIDEDALIMWREGERPAPEGGR